jgi:hypothetical protein
MLDRFIGNAAGAGSSFPGDCLEEAGHVGHGNQQGANCDLPVPGICLIDLAGRKRKPDTAISNNRSPRLSAIDTRYSRIAPVELANVAAGQQFRPTFLPHASIV